MNQSKIYSQKKWIVGITLVALSFGCGTDEKNLQQKASSNDPVEFVALKDAVQMRAAMSQLTQVPTNNNLVSTSFNAVQALLPSTNSVTTYNPAMVIGVASLASAFCRAIQQTTALRPTFAPGYTFGQAPGVNDGVAPAVARTLLSKFTLTAEADIPAEDVASIISGYTEMKAAAANNNTTTDGLFVYMCTAALMGPGSVAILQ